MPFKSITLTATDGKVFTIEGKSLEILVSFIQEKLAKSDTVKPDDVMNFLKEYADRVCESTDFWGAEDFLQFFEKNQI